ncbi:MAG: hypothetical protein A2653_01015 [Candidatus Zambryskibacteria bacterium RIFCSPHIGHO2_01_FULL_43_25]|uniref:HTH deoR-type domain-containing protein n=1 Tax=Candidatus Zambryskibacteria bacterium RIFCSPLOWO2_01_FULL_45_21 TaxID=1802761 RepID=A0A1G2U4E2_9BACT|nr:MAG: hypothetical protein A2653_01015 [Candidatus Zambryskibacteria bacterium RIFCSPHIGHO2_01_FULL_43_25]OHB00905.1 MAG: hypothetical protein A3E94_01485 [Candidatus Zambryskibacteria bacterium RIFCSPHIGHO2_12_FULL_44_12b]OHB04373.1 MAG: hypothetical protein A3B14_01835 [Candidatus Zambryskibacteria bacterium RIFCSPLOWO2_01_FULL_45_21]
MIIYIGHRYFPGKRPLFSKTIMEHNKEDKKEKRLVEVDENLDSKIGKTADFTDLFEKDGKLSFILKKTKRIIAAIFLISNFLPDHEPIKHSMKEVGIRLIHSATRIKDKKESDMANEFRAGCLEIVSLLDIAFFSGLITEMNFSIIKSEIHGLLSFYDTTFPGESSTNLQNGFFPAESVQDFAGDKPFSRKFTTEESFLDFKGKGDTVDDKNYIKDSDYPKNVLKTQRESGEDIKDIYNKGQNVDSSKKLKGFSPVAVKRNKRQSVIINFLKKKKSAMIKDISSLIGDCSEKTIQRELNFLVIDGVLYKEGERRWTRYFLAKV